MLAFGTRTLLELKVGKKYSVQVLLHLRACDVDWFNHTSSGHDVDDDDDHHSDGGNIHTNNSTHSELKSELMYLISKEILPAECKDQILPSHLNTGAANVSQSSGEKASNFFQKKSTKRKSGTGNRNIPSSSKASGLKDEKNNSVGIKLALGKGAAPTATGKETTDSKKRANASGAGTGTWAGNKKGKKNSAKSTETKPKTYLDSLDVKFLYGDNIQITYRTKEIKISHRVTLSYGEPILQKVIAEVATNESTPATKIKKKAGRAQRGKKATKNKGKVSAPAPQSLSTFQYLQPLSKMIEIWCYPFDGKNPKNLTMDITDGFVRSDFIPLSSLFRET
jgi:hypothetical protein